MKSDFRKLLDVLQPVQTHGVADESDFQTKVDRHLQSFAKRELPPANAPRDNVLLPLAILAEVQSEKAEKEQALALAECELNPRHHLINNKLTSGRPSLTKAECRFHMKPRPNAGIKIAARLFLQIQRQVSNAAWHNLKQAVPRAGCFFEETGVVKASVDYILRWTVPDNCNGIPVNDWTTS